MTAATRTKLTALMHIRVSTPSQEVDEQVRMIRQYAVEQGIEIVFQYGDYAWQHGRGMQIAQLRGNCTQGSQFRQS